jgi:hypothetical protein
MGDMEMPMGAGRVGFVARELDRIADALRKPQSPERYSQLHAAQQALSFALDPEHFAAPVETILSATGTPAS